MMIIEICYLYVKHCAIFFAFIISLKLYTSLDSIIHTVFKTKKIKVWQGGPAVTCSQKWNLGLCDSIVHAF